MIRKYTHWFLIGGVLSTDTTVADSIGEAASKFGANIKGITVPGYRVVKDDEYLADIQAAAQRILNDQT